MAELDPQLAVLGEGTVWDLRTRQHEVMVRLMRGTAIAPQTTVPQRSTMP